MKKTCLLILLSFLTAFLLLGCDHSPQQQPQQQPAASTQTLETGRFALQRMLAPARLWSPDAQPVNLRSQVFKTSNGHDGKSGYWRASFASPARLRTEVFTWSGMSGPDFPPKGVDHGAEDSFNPNNRSTQPFDLNFLKVDTDQAFDVAQQHGGKQLLEKDPDTPVTYLLDWDARATQLKWHVIYGGSEALARLSVLVDATTGQFLRKE